MLIAHQKCSSLLILDIRHRQWESVKILLAVAMREK